MLQIKGYWGRQFSNPYGIGGKIATFVMNRMNAAMYEAVYDSAQIDGNILDIGCGNGYTLEYLMRTSGGRFYGIDISDDMIRAAAKRNRKAIHDGRLALVKGSADAIPFEDGFDLIYTINTIYFWKDLNAGFIEIRTKLNPGGMFLNLFYTKEVLDRLRSADHGYNKYTPEELKMAAENNGFAAEIIPIAEGRSYLIKAVKQTGQ